MIFSKKILCDPTNFNSCCHNYCWKCIIEKRTNTCPFCDINNTYVLERDPVLNELVILYERLLETVNLQNKDKIVEPKCKYLKDIGKISDIKIVLDKSECKLLNDVNKKCDQNSLKSETPLHQAAIKGDLDKAVKFIDDISEIQNGAEMVPIIINTADFAGWTALHEACNHGNNEIVDYLLQKGANVNFLGYENVTPLHDAIANSHISCVRTLLEHGALVNLKNSMGLLPIEYATDETIKALILEKTLPNYLVAQNCKDDLIKKSPKDIKIVDVKSIPDLIPASSVSKLPVILTSGTSVLGLKEGQALDKFKNLFEATTVDKFDQSVTHLVVYGCHKVPSCRDKEKSDMSHYAAPKRNLKYLISVLKGKWILHSQWISDSVKSQKIEDELKYEVCGYGNESSFSSSLAPSKARINRADKKLGLFAGCKFYLKGSFGSPSLSKGEIISLLKMADGEVLMDDPSRCRIALDPSIKPQCFHVNHLEDHFLTYCRAIILVPAPGVKPSKSKRRSGSVEETGAACKNYVRGLYVGACDGKSQTLTYVNNPSEAIGKGEGDKRSEIVVLNTDWVLDCISRFQLIDCST